MTTQRSLDEQAPRALIPTCPKCGARLYPVIVDGVITGFNCIGCEEMTNEVWWQLSTRRKDNSKLEGLLYHY